MPFFLFPHHILSGDTKLNHWIDLEFFPGALLWRFNLNNSSKFLCGFTLVTFSSHLANTYQTQPPGCTKLGFLHFLPSEKPQRQDLELRKLTLHSKAHIKHSTGEPQELCVSVRTSYLPSSHSSSGEEASLVLSPPGAVLEQFCMIFFCMSMKAYSQRIRNVLLHQHHGLLG